MCGVEGALLLGEDAADRRLSTRDRSNVRRVGLCLQRRGADVAARHGIDLDADVGGLPKLVREPVGVNRPELDDRIAGAPLDPPCARDDADAR